MSRIKEAFAENKAFIPFITCADPDLETTAELIRCMERAGADIIELGIPFSDPTAEGPVIQAANLRALKTGVTTDKIFDMVKSMQTTVKVPLVFMTYANVVYSYGTEAFLEKAEKAGIAGLILPDVPFEEKGEIASVCKKYGIDFISMIAPTSHERTIRIAKEAEGFVYCVSSLGVTGVRNEITTDIGNMVKLVRQYTSVPAAVGFGVSTEEQAETLSKQSDGVIVGSAIVKIIEKYGKDAVPHVEEFVRGMKKAVLKEMKY